MLFKAIKKRGIIFLAALPIDKTNEFFYFRCIKFINYFLKSKISFFTKFLKIYPPLKQKERTPMKAVEQKKPSFSSFELACVVLMLVLTVTLVVGFVV